MIDHKPSTRPSTSRDAGDGRALALGVILSIPYLSLFGAREREQLKPGPLTGPETTLSQPMPDGANDLSEAEFVFVLPDVRKRL